MTDEEMLYLYLHIFHIKRIDKEALWAASDVVSLLCIPDAVSLSFGFIRLFLLLFNRDFNPGTMIVYRGFARFNVKISGLVDKTNDPSTSQKISLGN